MTLQEYLEKHRDRLVIDHAVRLDYTIDGLPKFYIHPANTGGDTLDFVAEGNQLVPVVNGQIVRE